MLKLIIELGPLLVFIATYKYSNIFVATSLMVIVTALCLILSYFVDRKISLPLLLSGVILIILGSVTILSGDSKYIKMKPTIAYLIFSATVYIGSRRDPTLLQGIIGQVITMDRKHWITLSNRFAVFFASFAFLNEIVWRNYSEDFWVNFKVFGAIPITLLFILSQLPFIYKNGVINKK